MERKCVAQDPEGRLKVFIDNGDKYAEYKSYKRLDYIDILNDIIELSYDLDKNDLRLLLELEDLAEWMAPSNRDLSYLFHIIREYLIFINYKHNEINEFDIHTIAKENLPFIIKDSRIIERKNNPKHIPDLWVNINKEDVPVEVKLHNFNNSALKQIKRYMKFYNCNSGIVIGERLTVNLPKNIRFISIEELKNKDNEDGDYIDFDKIFS